MLQSEAYNIETDIYSITLVLYEIFTGKIPYQDIAVNEFTEAIAIDNERPPLNHNIPYCIANILQAGWHANPAQRPNATQLIQLLNKAKDELLSHNK